MLQQDKQRLILLVVFAALLALIVYYVLWAFILNKGTIIFRGEPSYSISIDNKVYECTLSECELYLKTGKYNYQISREGYNTKYGYAEVLRGQRTILDSSLQYIPKLQEPAPYTVFSLPAGYSKFNTQLDRISLFRTFDPAYTLLKLPKVINNIVFSKSGGKAVVFQSDSASAYLVNDAVLTGPGDIVNALDADFTADESAFYTVAYDSVTDKFVLKKIKFDGSEIKDLIFFNRDLADYEIEVSDDEKFAVLADKTNAPEILYLIDLESATRTNVYEGNSVKLGKFSSDGNYFVFEGKDYKNEVPGLKFLDTATKGIENFTFNGGVSGFDFDSKSIGYFVTDSPYELNGYSAKFITTETGEITLNTLLSQTTAPKSLNVFKWDPQLSEFYLVADLTQAFDQIPSRLEVSPEGNVIRMLVSEQYYDLILAEI